MTDVYTDRTGSRWAQVDIDHNPLAASLHADLCHAVALAQQAIVERDEARTRTAEWLSEFKAQAATIAGLKASVKMHRQRADDLDAALSDAEHRLTQVADARGHGVS